MKTICIVSNNCKKFLDLWIQTLREISGQNVVLTEKNKRFFVQTDEDADKVRKAVSDTHVTMRYWEYSDEAEQERKDEDKKRLKQLEGETKFVECEYPAMGKAGSVGFAKFTSKEQADELVKLLIKCGSYYYGYHLQWDGEGDYVAEPSWQTDYDNEVIYSCTFKKG